MPTYLKPNGDLGTQVWNPSVATPSNSRLIDEGCTSPDGDSTYLYTGAYVTGTQATFDIQNLAIVVEPSTLDLHFLRICYRKEGAGNGPQNCRIRLENKTNGSVIVNAIYTEPATDDYVVHSIQLSYAEAAAIINWTDIRARLIAPTVGTGLAAEFRVTAFDFVVPLPGEFAAGDYVGGTSANFELVGDLDTSLAITGDSGLALSLEGDLDTSLAITGASELALSLEGDLALRAAFQSLTDLALNLSGDLSFGLGFEGESTSSYELLGDLAIILQILSDSEFDLGLEGDLSLSLTVLSNTELQLALEGDLNLTLDFQGATLVSTTLTGGDALVKGWIAQLTSYLRVLVSETFGVPIAWPNGPDINKAAVWVECRVSLLYARTVTNGASRVFGQLELDFCDRLGLGDNRILTQVSLADSEIANYLGNGFRLGPLKILGMGSDGPYWKVRTAFNLRSHDVYD